MIEDWVSAVSELSTNNVEEPKQATLETIFFGAEFVVIKHGIKVVRGLRYKLR